MSSKMSGNFSRRNFLKGVGIGALGLGLGGRTLLTDVRRARAQGGAVSAIFRHSVGDKELTIIQDGVATLDPSIFGVNAPEGGVAEFLEENNLPPAFSTTINIILVRDESGLTLMDTGNGAAASANLIPTLELLGIAPGDINHIVMSHFHPDHINGLVTDGELVFPNAEVHFPTAEYEFLQNAPTGTPFDALIQTANDYLGLAEAADQLTFFESDAEVLPGVQSIATLGHTPGHHSFLLSSGDAQLMATVDVANNAHISLAHPEWFFGFDAIPEQASETRKAVFGRAADEKLQILAYHFPFPGIGFIDRDGEGFKFLPQV
jgi:glyoxylase-like metal-dependent hydrolase (beta-lactamase superfamily II)